MLKKKSILPYFVRSGHQTIEFKKNLMLIGGMSNDLTTWNNLLISNNGIEWKLFYTPIAMRQSFSSIVHEERLWLIGGMYYTGTSGTGGPMFAPSEVAVLEDRLSMRTYPNNPVGYRVGGVGVSFQGKIWVIGGQRINAGCHKMGLSDEILYSLDGMNWTQPHVNFKPSPRSGAAGVVFKDSIWIVGGQSDRGRLSDVWCSMDGLKWEQTLESCPWHPRSGHSLSVFNDRLWVIGGVGTAEVYGIKRLRDVWSSTDGTNWTCHGEFPELERFGHTATALDGKLWVISGSGLFRQSEIGGKPIVCSDNGNDWIQINAKEDLSNEFL